jgi:hypothetical protein
VTPWLAAIPISYWFAVLVRTLVVRRRVLEHVDVEGRPSLRCAVQLRRRPWSKFAFGPYGGTYPLGRVVALPSELIVFSSGYPLRFPAAGTHVSVVDKTWYARGGVRLRVGEIDLTVRASSKVDLRRWFATTPPGSRRPSDRPTAITTAPQRLPSRNTRAPSNT